MTTKESSSDLIRAQDLKGVDVWRLPSFDPDVPEPEPEPVIVEEAIPEPEPESQEVPIEEVKPLTLEELEAIRQDAYNEGFATGEKDGFRAGQLKARQESEEALTPKLAALETLLKNLFAPIAEQDQQLEEAMVALVEHVVREVIQRELEIDSSQIRQVLTEALKLLPMGAENIRVFVNPQDFELIKALRERQEENWRILEDASLLPGGCRVESEVSRIDATMETRLDLAIKQLLDQKREQRTNPQDPDMDIDLEAPVDEDAPDAP
ncbi:flagellar assembly protein FliH [Ectopseudomonas mendocina]|uniref:Flagellar assembly protein FliH n=1 Tax=Ectopseudomonas mendocina TaxID=300 RepID=A0ABZ2RBV2_ECTME